MKAELNFETDEIDVYIEEKDMCKSCSKAYRCSMITAIKNNFVYMASSKNYIEDCWDWQPYDDDETELNGEKIV